MQDFAASRLAEVEHAARSYLGDVAALEPVAQDELSRRLRDGQVLVLDVRPEAEYAAGHIPGAVNVPHDQLAARLAELPDSTDIVAYCRGRYCVFAPDAVRLLRAQRVLRPAAGRRAARLAAGRAARHRRGQRVTGTAAGSHAAASRSRSGTPA